MPGFAQELKNNFKDEEFFVALNTVLFLSFQQMLEAVTTLDGKLVDFKVFQSSLGLFFFCRRLVS